MAAPADDGELKARIEALAARAWRHPTTGESIRFSFKTIERWWYIARGALGPLRRPRPQGACTRRHPSERQSRARRGRIARQHRDHPRWTWQLHHDNLVALAREDPHPRPGTRLRHRVSLHARAGPRQGPQSAPPRARGRRAVRGSRYPPPTRSPTSMASGTSTSTRARAHVLIAGGQWQKPQLLGVLDDRSRLCCHLQVVSSTRPPRPSYPRPAAQAFHKRGLPRALLTDNGAAMLAAETRRRPRAPRRRPPHDAAVFPRAKRESRSPSGEQIEGASCPCSRASLRALAARPAQHRHPGLGRGGVPAKGSTPRSASPPSRAACAEPSVARESPSSDALRRAFRTAGDHTRPASQRRHRHTPAACASRVPSAYRTLLQLRLRVARWDPLLGRPRRPRVPATPSPRSCPSTRPETPSVCAASSSPRRPGRALAPRRHRTAPARPHGRLRRHGTAPRLPAGQRRHHRRHLPEDSWK